MRIMISCGEASGDLYAGALASELCARAPEAEIFGFGGQRLKSAGGRLIGDYGGFAVTGLTEAIRVVPRSFAMLRRLVDTARELRPHVFVAIDAPDFNFRLLSALRRLGIPIVYYVSPQLWAWRPGRMETMKAYVDRVLVIFPFEEELYRRAGVSVQFVGHPLVDLAKEGEERTAFLRDRGLNPDAPTVALLPGSRRNEIDRVVPVLAAALPLIRARVPQVQFVVACAPGIADGLFAPLVNDSSGSLVLVRDRTDDVLAAADMAITASGTATIQCAIHETPMVVVYKVSAASYAIGRRFIRVDHISLPNIIAGRAIVPELIQDDANAERIAAEMMELIVRKEKAREMKTALAGIRGKLGTPGASQRTAEIACDMLFKEKR